MQHEGVVIDVKIGLLEKDTALGTKLGHLQFSEPHLLKQPRKDQKRMSGFVMSGFESCLLPEQRVYVYVPLSLPS